MYMDLLDISDAHIALVDPDAEQCELLLQALRAKGFNNLSVFHHPQNALDQFRSKPPDLILFDYVLPNRRNRIDILRLFVTHNQHPLPLIVAMTADRCRSTRIEFFKLGVQDFLAKPIDAEESICRIVNLLRLHLAYKESLQHNDNLDDVVRHRTEALVKTQAEILERLGVAAEFKDKDTHLHTMRVGQFAGCLARQFGFNADLVEEITVTAPLHDIGKIGVPDSVLLKPGKLDPQEWELIKEHTTHGFNILKGSDSSLLKAAETIALSHHERWDGQGYPKGLKRLDIPVYGRITAIADVYDALTSPRPYKAAWPHQQAAALIADGRGSQFDPEMVDAFSAVRHEFIAIAGRLS